MTTLHSTGRRALALCLVAAGLLATGAYGAGPAETEIKALGTVPTRAMAPVALSADGTHVAYVIKAGEKFIVVFDGKDSAEYDQVRGLTVSSDGKHVAYAAMREGTWVIVLDGKETERYAAASGPAFSADGKHFAFCAGQDAGRVLAVVDGATRTQYVAVGQEPPVFSPDGRRVAYEARSGGGGAPRITMRDPNRPATPNEPAPSWTSDEGKEYDVGGGTSAPRLNFLVVDERKGERCNDVRFTTFSPDGKHVAYAVLFGKLWFIVVDEKKVTEFYEDVTPPVFSPDARCFAFAGMNEKKWTVVGPRKDDKKYDGVRSLRFSPDGKHFAFAAIEGRTWSIDCDGKKGPAFDEIGAIVFSMDSGHLAYAARKGGAWTMVVDGVQTPPHGAIHIPGGAAAQELDKLRYLVVDANEGRLVEVPWPMASDWSAGLK